MLCPGTLLLRPGLILQLLRSLISSGISDATSWGTDCVDRDITQ